LAHLKRYALHDSEDKIFEAIPVCRGTPQNIADGGLVPGIELAAQTISHQSLDGRAGEPLGLAQQVALQPRRPADYFPAG
jgi:hypothetical protein